MNTETTLQKIHASPVQSRWTALVWLIPIGVILALVYVRLLIWLGRVSLHRSQLSNGAVLVLFAVVLCLQDTLGTLRLKPSLRQQGLWLIFLGFACFWLTTHFPHWVLPLVLLSFCLSFAGVISFLFGELGVRQFLPAIGAFLVFGLLAGLFPSLDWPLRAVAGRYAANLLAALGLPVKLGLARGEPPHLVLLVHERAYRVATECNGFGLLTSALLLATILAFLRRLPWLRKLSLFALAVPVAIGCNFLRIVAICLVAPRVPLPYGWVHEIIGLIFYYLGLSLIWFAPGLRPRSPPPRPAPAPCA